MNTKVVALLLAGIISSGLIYSHPAYAHNFGGDESAGFLAKVQEIKTELEQISMNLSNPSAIDYYVDATGEYWNANDTKEMGERNQLLAKEIPDTLDAIFMAAKMSNPNADDVNAKITQLNGYLDEAVPVRIDKDKLNNSTVNALAVTNVLKEVLEKYGDAINSTQDLNDISEMKDMSGMQSSGSSMSGMESSMAATVVDENAYGNAKALAATATNMFNDLMKKYPNVTENSKISDAFTELNQQLDNKAAGNDVMITVHTKIHPNLITGYNIQVVPEFPMPALLVIISIIGMIAITRFRSMKLRQ